MSLPDLNRTVIAPATPSGKGALAILRITGKDSFQIFSKMSSGKYLKAAHKQVSLVKIHKGKEHIDDAVVLFFKAPNSYTGEDIVEIICHGSSYIVREILNFAIHCGAFLASPGEFTLRAFINGKMDLARAEAVNALISSDSSAAHHAAICQTEGQLSSLILSLKDRTLSVLAEIEARLDDSDGDLYDPDYKSMYAEILSLRNETQKTAETFRAGKFMREGIKTVLAGAPNSGKSSLMNVMLGYDRAIVSPNAGTTRDTLETSTEINGVRVILTDTAGLAAVAGDSIEKEGMERAVSALRQADMVLLLKDSSCEETDADRLAERQVRQNLPDGSEIIRVFTKADLSGKKTTGTRKGIAVSSVSGYGLDQLKAAITSRAEDITANSGSPSVIYARHYEALSVAADELGDILLELQGKNVRMEICAEHLRAALKSFGLITGETVPDDVLEKIFSSFCVGK